MIDNVNALEGLDFTYPHYCQATKDNLGYISAIFNDENGNEYCKHRIELSHDSITIIRSELSMIENPENKEMLTNWFEGGLDLQLKIRAEIKVLATRMQLESGMRGAYFDDDTALLMAKSKYSCNITHPTLDSIL